MISLLLFCIRVVFIILIPFILLELENGPTRHAQNLSHGHVERS